MPLDRVPFDLAISDPKLLKHHFETLSGPQQVVLKAFNGLELSDELNPKTGKSELDYWSMLQGGAEFDHLGFVTKINPVPYFPKKYDTLVAILGRRSGKTDRITATQIAYEALLGGHMKHVQPGQDVQILFIAQDIDMASSHLNFIYNAIMSSPLLAKEIQDKNQDAILLRNGLKIVPAPPTIKSSRGMAVPGWCGDEVGFWYKDNKAANPDYEVERAVEYAMAQFPDSFKFITSTPYTKEGMLWEYHLAGTEGNKLRCEACTASGIRYCAHNADDREEHEGVLVVHAPTAAMENPKITRKKLIKLQKQDPEAFVRESLAQFVDSISGFLSPEVLQSCISKKITERPRYPRPGSPGRPDVLLRRGHGPGLPARQVRLHHHASLDGGGNCAGLFLRMDAGVGPATQSEDGSDGNQGETGRIRDWNDLLGPIPTRKSAAAGVGVELLDSWGRFHCKQQGENLRLVCELGEPTPDSSARQIDHLQPTDCSGKEAHAKRRGADFWQTGRL
jgi:hypothetical protein